MSASYLSTRSLVRALRLKHALTQEQLAEKAKIDHKYYQRFELGDTPNPSLDMLERLGKVFDLPPWVLICDDDAVVLRHAGLSSDEIEKLSRRVRGRPKKPA